MSMVASLSSSYFGYFRPFVGDARGAWKYYSTTVSRTKKIDENEIKRKDDVGSPFHDDASSDGGAMKKAAGKVAASVPGEMTTDAGKSHMDRAVKRGKESSEMKHNADATAPDGLAMKKAAGKVVDTTRDYEASRNAEKNEAAAGKETADDGMPIYKKQ